MADSTSSPRSRVAQVFKKFDADGLGCSRKDLASVTASLDPGWTEQRVSEVLDAAGMPCDGALDLEKLLEWVFSESPAGAGAGDGPEQGPLTAHFLSESYSLGLPLSADGTGYALAESGSGAPVYRHEATGVRVWQEALDFCPEGGGGERRVLFRYADEAVLTALAAAPVLTRALWASFHQPSDACALLASGKEPSMLAGGAPGGVDCCVPLLVPAGTAAHAAAGAAEGAAPGGLAPEDPWLVRGESKAALLGAAAAARERRKRRALQHCQSALGEGDRNTLTAANELIFLLEALGRLPEAVALCQRTKEAAERCLGAGDPHTLSELSNLAYLVERSGDLKEAEALARSALEGREAALGGGHADTMTSAYNLAELLEATGKLDEAEALFQRELAWCRSTYGARATQTRASTRNLNRFWQEHQRGSCAPKTASRLQPGKFTTSG